ncbi:MAG: hypothetical protein RIG68_03605 [Imperialibacter sp.]|uniref:hypothetical protein n=1 Tax=Imperialibacter sp. TaxID=2038411 RepID=UPI0032ED45C6
MKNLLLIIFLIGCFGYARATETEKIKIEKTLKFATPSPDNVLEIYNINGSLQIEGYDGQEIMVTTELTISGKTQALLDKGKSEMSLGILEDDSALVLYNKAPFIHNERIEGPCNCHWNWSKDVDYKFSFDFKVKVPRGVNLHVRTVNDGFIAIDGMNSNVSAHHVNGDVTLTQMGGSVEARTINGELLVRHTKAPVGGNSYYSLNGDVNVYYPGEPDADITFKSFNGSFYTDMERLEVMPPAWTKEVTEKNGSTRYKLTQKNNIKVGKGGNLLAFETFNGDIYVKKSK